MRAIFVFIVLVVVKAFSMIFYRFRKEFVAPTPRRWWRGIRVLAVLNHTSLYEPLLIGFAPIPLVWDLARHGVLPIAEKTMKRPIGRFFANIVRHVVVVTRQRDSTWDEVLNHVDAKAVVMILPEGRMKRRNGLDSNGRPMTVRGGIADILQSLPDGKMLVVYSGGLHHVQSPGEKLPRVFKTINARMEQLDIAEYKQQLQGCDDGSSFKHAVIKDLEHRRDIHCAAAERASLAK